MAGQSRIIARIANVTRSSGTPDSNAEFIVEYRCTGPVLGLPVGEVVIQADITQSESALKGDLSAALAAAVNPLVTPPQAYTQADVRGLNL